MISKRRMDVQVMNTRFLLLAQYQRAAVPLDDVAADYLGLGSREAKRQALDGTLCVPAFRRKDSQKAPWMVMIDDLAEWLDTQAERARRDHKTLRQSLGATARLPQN